MIRITPRSVAVGYAAAAMVAVVALARLPFRTHQSGPDAGPMIQDVSSNRVSIAWWSKAGGEGEIRLRGRATDDRRFVAVRHGNRYEARAEGLEGGNTYAYEMLQTDADGLKRRLCTGQVATAKRPGARFAFIVFGDSGSGERSQYRLAKVMNEYPMDFVLHVGDLVYRMGELRHYHKKFFRPYRDLISHVPFYGVLGNHDVRTDNGKPFLDTFSLPTNGPPSVEAERCYWFDYGDARFVGLDSTLDRETLAADVVPWLRAVLDASPALWKIVFFHHPPWPGGNRQGDSTIRDTLVPAIEDAQVDVVFCGHNHLYERTYPMLGGRVDPSNGVVYVTTGAGGKTLHEEHHGAAPHLAVFNDETESFTWAHVSSSSLEIMQIGAHDEILDSAVVRKRDHSRMQRGSRD